jgi:uncharacterized protein (DUF2344 family)
MKNETDFEFDLRPYKKVSKKKMKKIWKDITSKPFPSIDAYILENKEYERIILLLQESSAVVVQDMFEYGKTLDPVSSEAVVFRPVCSKYLILIKRESRCTLKENLEHELEHIAKKEVKLH